MKRNLFFLAAAALFSACASHYVVTDRVDRHLNGTRTLLTADTSSSTSAANATPCAMPTARP